MKKVDRGWRICVERSGLILCPHTFSKRCEKSHLSKCGEIKEEGRRNIFYQFWAKMNWEQCKVYVNGLVESENTVTNSIENSRRQSRLGTFSEKMTNDYRCV